MSLLCSRWNELSYNAPAGESWQFITASVSFAETVKGPCTLVYDKSGRTINKHVEFASTVKGKCDFKLQDSAGATVIVANGEFTNTGDKAMGFAYYVSFFDKEANLIGSANFTYFDKDTALAAGKSIRSGSCIIKVPDSVRDKAASYQVAFYEFARPE